MLNNEFLNKDPDMVLEQATLIIWDSKSDVCVDNNGKYTKHIRHMAWRMHLARNGEDWNFHKTVWCEVSLQLSEIGTNNVKDDELNLRLGYTMVRLDNW